MHCKMETEETLETMIKEYEAQLTQVEMAIGMSAAPSQDDLMNLSRDLKQLIELTKDSLLSMKKKRLLQEIESMQQDDLMAPKVHETKCADAHGGVASTSRAELTETLGKNDADMQRLLESLEGSKCQAPFGHSWGQTGYYNALVLSAEPNQNIINVDDIQVRVLFCNPTSDAMKPCPYYMDGECRFSDDECRFSHGHVVAFQTLKQFEDPDYSLLQRDAPCLAKFTDGLWYPAIVESVDGVEHKITIKYSQYGTIATLEMADIVPKELEIDSGSDDNFSNDDNDEDQICHNSDSDKEVDSTGPVTAWISTAPTSQALGQWEKYTKGIGSKLMVKMGYILGMGLGKNGEGRTEPVEAVVLPQGKSLDRVMELKEQAGNRNLLKVEKKFRRKQRKKEKIIQDGYTYEKAPSVFEFINTKLANEMPKVNDLEACSSTKSQVSKEKQILKSATIKHLNTQSFQVSEDIRKAQLELNRLQTALTRNETKDRVVSSQLKDKINQQESKLLQLKGLEKAIHGEQNLRKSDKKLAIF